MPYDVTLTRDLSERGYAADELARMTRDGALVRVRRGAYAEPIAGDADQRLEHLRLVRACVRLGSPKAVVSHLSAAALHDLPLWTDRLDRAQLTLDRRGGGRRRRFVERHGTPLPASDVTMIDDLPVTTLARTVLDVCCALPLRRAVAVGDAARRRGVSAIALERQLQKARGRAGIVRARRTIPFLDPRSESPGESVSRVDLDHIGVPPTELQYDVFADDGTFIGRSDFGWPEHKTLGEYDGRGKYGDLRRPGRSAADVLWEEKEREDRLRDLGWQVVRWTWTDLQDLPGLRQRLLRAFARGDRLLGL